jgi:hypothetical protein
MAKVMIKPKSKLPTPSEKYLKMHSFIYMGKLPLLLYIFSKKNNL